MKVLLLDDDLLHAEGMFAFLGRHAITPLLAHCVEDVLRILVEEPEVDVLLMDMGVSGLSANQMLRILRHEHPLLEVVLMGSRQMLKDAVKCLEIGAYDFLLKPCAPDLVLRVVLAAVERRKDQRLRVARVRDLAAQEPAHIMVPRRNK